MRQVLRHIHAFVALFDQEEGWGMRGEAMKQSAKKQIDKALDKVNREINNSTDRNNLYSRGLSREGWQGGYAQALMDVLLILNGVTPNTRNYWD
jgi:hypothetical protein